MEFAAIFQVIMHPTGQKRFEPNRSDVDPVAAVWAIDRSVARRSPPNGSPFHWKIARARSDPNVWHEPCKVTRRVA